MHVSYLSVNTLEKKKKKKKTKSTIHTPLRAFEDPLTFPHISFIFVKLFLRDLPHVIGTFVLFH